MRIDPEIFDLLSRWPALPGESKAKLKAVIAAVLAAAKAPQMKAA